MGLAKSSLTITALNGVTILMGFASNLVVAKSFGTSPQMDAFLAASTLPLFLITIINGSLGYTFIPVLAEYRKSDEASVWKLVSTLMNLFIIAGFALVVGVMVFAQPIMAMLAPGFDGAQVGEASRLLRWQMPLVGMSVMNELMSSVYYSKGNFFRPMLFKAVAPIMTIIYVSLLSGTLSVLSLAVAQLSALGLQTLVLAAGFLREKEFRYEATMRLGDQGVSKVLRLMLPLLAGMCVYKIVPLIERGVASGLPAGTISTLGYAWKLFGTISPLVSAGITMSIFPRMARLKAENDLAGLKRIMSKGIRSLLFLNMPIVFLLGLFGKDIVGLVLERGAFTHADTVATSMALAIYLIALPAGAVGSIIGQGYYVFQDTRTPAILGIVEVVFYGVAAYALVPRFGIYAIPGAYAAYLNFSLLNGLMVRSKLGGVGGSAILKAAAAYACLAIGSAGCAYLAGMNITGALARSAVAAGGLVLYLILGRFLLKNEVAVWAWDNGLTILLQRSRWISKLKASSI